MTVTGITVDKLPVIGWWYVSATITQQILWQVRAATGPSGQVSVNSALDPVITAANWQTVADDLNRWTCPTSTAARRAASSGPRT